MYKAPNFVATECDSCFFEKNLSQEGYGWQKLRTFVALNCFRESGESPMNKN